VRGKRVEKERRGTAVVWRGGRGEATEGVGAGGSKADGVLLLGGGELLATMLLGGWVGGFVEVLGSVLRTSS
jgi:hypothetical protein